eukprot:TRINITY_DN1683_c0_g1_i1.p1 TRINITY_DN1683_c0_g1~~TRINITY_DN1683_c0_g1_i1.p1  ORF type:complete len:341 (+),score=49.39 TRINITY_DN1683_c0_g1_i1:81-1103(+)
MNKLKVALVGFILCYSIFVLCSYLSSNTDSLKRSIENEFLTVNSSFLSPYLVNISAVENFWDSRPCNLRHSNKEVGTKEYFDEVEKRKYFVEPHIPSFADFNLWKGKHILEIGCGLGTESVNFIKNGAASLTIIELSSVSLNLTKIRFETMLNIHFNSSVMHPKVRLIKGNAENLLELLHPEDRFDLVWSFGVLHHTPHPEKIYQQIPQILKPDGQLRIMVYSKISYKLLWLMKKTNMWTFEDNLTDKMIQVYSEAQTGSPVTWTYTFEEIRELVEGASDQTLKVKKVWKDHIFPWKVEKYVNYEYEKEEEWKFVSEKRMKEVEAELGFHTLLIAHKVGA